MLTVELKEASNSVVEGGSAASDNENASTAEVTAAENSATAAVEGGEAVHNSKTCDSERSEAAPCKEKLNTNEAKKVETHKTSADKLVVNTTRDRNESTASDGSTIELLKRRNTVLEDDDFVSPIDLLPGETILFQGHTVSQQLVLLTSFRLFVTRAAESFVNVPLSLIDSVECVETSRISILCKDGSAHCCSLESSDTCFKWLSRIKQEISFKPEVLGDFFAATFYSEINSGAESDWEVGRFKQFSLDSEIRRLGFKKNWKITTINEDYSCCSSYPKENLVPKDFDDDSLERVAKFRGRSRFPSAIWRNRENGCVLLRCSQPLVGLFCNRSSDDEQLMQEIMEACGTESMVIVDCRSYTVAMSNRATGGGFEYPEYYINCEVKFMSLPNIHHVRSSFLSVRTLLSNPVSDANWYPQLDATHWMLYLSCLLETARGVAENLAVMPVLVHCTDGWDRTPQIISLAQLIIDPYYRTFKGFQVLIEKDWLSFGHKFAHRCGHTLGGSDPSEVSPAFLQWLDAVYQLSKQFPTAFEFNEAYLRKLMQHVYSCMFGTFLCNTEKEREELKVYENTISLWSYLDNNRPHFANKLYTSGSHKVLNVSTRICDLTFWISAYASTSASRAELRLDQSTSDEPSGLVRSHSYTDVSSPSSNEAGNTSGLRNSRRLSDPDLSSSLTNDTGVTAIPLHTNASAANLLSGSSFLSSSPVVTSGNTREANQPSAANSEQILQERSYIGYSFDSYIDQDGLTSHRDPVQNKIEDIVASYKRKISRLEKKIADLEKKPARTLTTERCQCVALSPDDIETARSADSSSDRSDSSWEELSHKDNGLTLWIPDHAVSSCTACQLPFRVFRRKHHCRQCGLVFCQSCAGAFVPIPEQQLFDPVRVCQSCYNTLTSDVYAAANSETVDTELEDQMAQLSEASGGVVDKPAIVCCSSPRTIPTSNNGSLHGLNDRSRGVAGNSSDVPALLPVTSQSPSRANSSHTNSFSNLSYKTCSQESINSLGSKHMDDQHMVRSPAKC